MTTFPTDWAGYDEIIPVNPGGALTDFTFIINLGKMSATWWSNVSSDGSDIRVGLPDGVTQLPQDLISFTAGSPGSGLLAVKYSGTLAASGTQKIRVYSGCSGASALATGDTYGQYNAYASSRKAFYWNGGGNDRTNYQNNLTMTGSPTVGGANGAFNGAKATDYNGSSQYGTATASVPTAHPLTILTTGSANNTTADHGAAIISDNASTTHYWAQEYWGASVGDKVVGRLADALGAAFSESTAAFTANTFYRGIALFTNSTSRNGGIDGVLGTEDVQSRTPLGIDHIAVGCRLRSSAGTFFAGKLSMVEVHTVALSTSWLAYDKLMHKPGSADQSDFYTFSGWSANTPPAPINSVAPAVSGTKLVGQTLTTTDGTWDSGSTSGYRWQTATDNSGTGAANITSQTASTLVLTESQAALYIRSGVSRTSVNGTTEAMSAWYGPIQVERYINPTTGSDSNNGRSGLPWATFEHANDYITSNPGVVKTLYIDTSSAPLYVATDNIDLNSTRGQNLTVTSATSDYADIRFWQSVDGSTAVPYDAYYSSSGHENIWVLVTREEAAIWEYMGGRGDNLKWFDHLKALISPSATYNNSTNLSTLNTTPWTFWTGDDGDDFVTLFNASGDPSGREFAVTYRPNQNVWGNPIEIDYGTLRRLCFGGSSGISDTGTTGPNSLCQAEHGATIDDCILYAGGTHLALGGDGDSTTWSSVRFGQMPGWEGSGAVTPHVWYSETTTAPPTITGCNCQAVFGKRGSTAGCNFGGSVDLGNITQFGNFILSHGAGVDATPVVVADSYLAGRFTIPVTGTNSSFGAVSGGATLNYCTLLNFISSVQGSDSFVNVFNDCLCLLNLNGVDSSHFPFMRGTVTLQSCTIVPANFLPSIVGTRPIFDASQGVLNLTVNDCIIVLNNVSDSSAINLTRAMNLDTDDVLAATRNIYIGATSAVIHNSLTSTTQSDRTLAQLQSLSKESSSVSDPGNVNTKLRFLDDYTVPSTSIAFGNASTRTNAHDRSGAVFVSRTTTGAYEPTADKLCGTQRVGISLGVGL